METKVECFRIKLHADVETHTLERDLDDVRITLFGNSDGIEPESSDVASVGPGM